jgi:hypothetical protein
MRGRRIYNPWVMHHLYRMDTCGAPEPEFRPKPEPEKRKKKAHLLSEIRDLLRSLGKK